MPRISLLIISLYFLLGGIAHFVSTDSFVAIMPAYLSYHWELVIISGIFELLGAIGLLVPKMRLWAGYSLMALSVAVFPANINMALNSQHHTVMSELLLYARLPLQPLLIWFIWWAIAKERANRS